ncbi:Mov34/MPN/PAD-1 family protein [uncultured Chryseobacterium sp.]|uniref:Mov34/MPN/PAD-1 family protein n=1 Tax=uncultured Chryseobacterium sp. TaxID=259322 RepID=UPI00258789C1|nr:Mov34/MPN/PAD-1 family protein [uncultured Chryseobacterium sp.]
MNFKFENIDIIINEDLLNIFSRYIQDDNKKNEAGGILTGLIFNDRIEICNCSTPTQHDKRSRYNFIRSKITAQEFLETRFSASDGREIYLGEWHTHPEQDPTPSYCDVSNFKKTIKINKLYSDFFFMIIMGTRKLYFAIYNKKGKVCYDNLRLITDN